MKVTSAGSNEICQFLQNPGFNEFPPLYNDRNPHVQTHCSFTGCSGYQRQLVGPDSIMTNATVADLATSPSTVPGGQKLILKYKDGEKVVIVPPGAPVVSFKPGKQDEAALLVAGPRVVITAQERDGKPTALRLLVGRNGFAPGAA